MLIRSSAEPQDALRLGRPCLPEAGQIPDSLPPSHTPRWRHAGGAGSSAAALLLQGGLGRC